jgi:hypothetical protein
MTEATHPDPRGDFGAEPGPSAGEPRPHADGAGHAHALASGHVESEPGRTEDESGHHHLPVASEPIDRRPLRERFGRGGA